MSGLMNNYFYGKAGKADYTPEQLPANRVALFFEMLRIRMGGLAGMNLLSVLGALPTVIWTWLSIQVMNYNFTAAEEAAAAGTPIQPTMLDGTLLIYLLGLIPCLMFFCLINTGVTYILRNWARDQHTFTFSDLKDAIKGNWKGSLLLGFLNGVSLLLAYVAYSYYGVMAATGGMFWIVPQMLIVIILALWWMANMLITPMMVTYDMNFRTLVRNSMLMIVARFPWALLIGGLSLLIPVAVLLFVPYGTLITLVVYAVIGIALTSFIHVSFANACFDRFLNPRIEGAQVNMGLRDPSYAEDDVEVTEEDIKNL